MSKKNLIGFNTKNDMHTKWEFFQAPLKAVADIHDFGNIKYEMYSWTNAPEISYSTVESSAGSLMNHYLLYKTGQMYDTESGYSHTAHMCVRSQMTLAPFYRNIHPEYYKKITPSREVINNILKTTNCRQMTEDLFTDQISPELLISIKKYKPEYLPTDITSVALLYNHLVIMLNKYGNNITTEKDIWNNVLEIDLIFWCSCALHNDFLNTGNKYRLFVPKEIKSGWTEEEQKRFMEQC